MKDKPTLNPDLEARLPQSYALLTSGNLLFHPSVARVTLHGSRGPRGGFRPDSDIDLSLIVNTEGLSEREVLEHALRDVLETTLRNWKGSVELDLAAVFDASGCGLLCFDREKYDETVRAHGGVDCFGIYKIQKGFSGFVETGVSVREMYPFITIYRRG